MEPRLKTTLDNHAKWLRGDGGARADLRGANLRGGDLSDADLRGANLRGADLRDADLSDANLRGADLRDADLRGANLRGADLSDADLRDADLRGGDLSDADLRGANLCRADLRDANLRGADLPTRVVIPDIDAAILRAIEAPGHGLEMASWHTCETTHCRAGWAIHLAGEAGWVLEDIYGPSAAGALIYAASRPHLAVPDFLASNEAAMADLRACARAQSDGGSDGA